MRSRRTEIREKMTELDTEILLKRLWHKAAFAVVIFIFLGLGPLTK